MKIKSKPMGDYGTNCYIVEINEKQIIIDPGVDAFSWIKENAKKPVAILNTHGHFDHIWSNSEIAKFFNIPIYCPRGDVFMLQNDPFSYGVPKSKANFEVKPNEVIKLLDTNITFHHFPGHTPGCSAIEIGDNLFSGDFIFNGSIGRVDFPFSSKEDMKKSLQRVLSFTKNYTIYPGHGGQTSLNNEKRSLKAWLNYL
ncbi:MAG: MBL fold metallo-hydrolase [Epsilonproteobacteria bacterium]|nr:MBL fold metallo-hydrolase [Campylobacterota bacterium]